MTEQPTNDTTPLPEDPHPDEGTIHAWLEAQLAPAAAEEVASHVRYCRACTARVEEARVLIADSARLVAGLDDPSRPYAMPGEDQLAAARVRAGSSSVWRWARLTPGRAALAASLLVALGITLTQRRTVRDVVPAVDHAMVAAAPRPAVPDDHLLDSAVARRVAETQPPRTVEAAKTLAMPAAPAPAPAVELAQPQARSEVAAGRAAARASREAPGVSADQANTAAPAQVAAATAPPADMATAAASSRMTRRAMPTAAGAASGGVAAATADAPAANPSAKVAPPAPQECYVIEAADGAARSWGPIPLPFVVAVMGPSAGDAAIRSAFAAQGSDTTAIAWTVTSTGGVSARPSGLAARGFGTLALRPGSDEMRGEIATAAAGASEPRTMSRRVGRDARTAAFSVIARRTTCGSR